MKWTTENANVIFTVYTFACLDQYISFISKPIKIEELNFEMETFDYRGDRNV